MKSKTKISKQAQKKQSQKIVETILAAKKHPEWLQVANILSGSRRNFLNLNLDEIGSQAKDSKENVVVVPGKVLSQGEIKGKIKIAALGFSEKAREKLKSNEVVSLLEEIKSNPSAKGVKILMSKK